MFCIAAGDSCKALGAALSVYRKLGYNIYNRGVPHLISIVQSINICIVCTHTSTPLLLLLVLLILLTRRENYNGNHRSRYGERERREKKRVLGIQKVTIPLQLVTPIPDYSVIYL